MHARTGQALQRQNDGERQNGSNICVSVSGQRSNFESANLDHINQLINLICEEIENENDENGNGHVHWRENVMKI